MTKANSRDGLPVHSFQTLLADLATLTRNRVRMHGKADSTADVLARPTPLQNEAFKLLGLKRVRADPGRFGEHRRGHRPASWLHG